MENQNANTGTKLIRKCGFVSIVGRPNAGKSTLFNQLLGQKVAIVSPKPQTTRGRILGVITDDEAQVVFLDTPGVHKPQNKLGETMIEAVSSGVEESDLIIVISDALKGISSLRSVLPFVENAGCPVMLVLNKTDMCDKGELLTQISEASRLYEFCEIVPLSARTGEGVPLLLNLVKKYLPEGRLYYPEDFLTDSSVRDMSAEILREKLMRLLKEEVPHGIAIDIRMFREKKNSVYISADIICEKKSHKGIIIGKNGETLKLAATQAREDIEKLTEKNVFLECWVRVKEDWRENIGVLKELGFK